MTGRVLCVLCTLLALVACSAAPTGTPATPTTTLVVFAASSLSATFTPLGAQFEKAHPGVTVKFSYDGSAALVDQLTAGAPADVFASADTLTMDRASAAGAMAGTPVRFASNELTLIVPPGNPAKVTGLDASLTGTKLVVCAVGVPCGSATAKLAKSLGATLTPVSEETKVTDVRAKVESGQADVGIVYVTDARASGAKVEQIPIRGADAVRNDYLIGVTHNAGRTDLAREFVDLVTGAAGQQALAAAGFGS